MIKIRTTDFLLVKELAHDGRLVSLRLGWSWIAGFVYVAEFKAFSIGYDPYIIKP